MVLIPAIQLYCINTINGGHNICYQNGVLQMFIGHINANTPRVLIFYKANIFLMPEEMMLLTFESSSQLNSFSVIREIIHITLFRTFISGSQV